MDCASDLSIFDRGCRRCPRLGEFLDAVRARHPRYYAAPVPPFGDIAARLLVIGLAPGLHGANATGRPFTGDHAGILLYRTLHRFGFANHAESIAADDDLVLRDCRITNAVKCLPPHNKPLPQEVTACRDYLATELARMPPGGVLIALGRVAHETVLRAVGAALKDHPFAHGAEHALVASDLRLLDSYHCSRYNTQTGRLTTPMFEAVFARARALLGSPS